jgi:hypothetical protein
MAHSQYCTPISKIKRSHTGKMIPYRPAKVNKSAKAKEKNKQQY